MNIDFNDPRDTRLIHRYTNQLFAHFHRHLVVGDEQELRGRRHLFHQLAEAIGVGIIQRRIDLVQQTEWCRIQAEQREHQRQCGQCFLATRQQLDRLHFLARRLRKYLQTRIENFLAGQAQVRVAAAEQGRE